MKSLLLLFLQLCSLVAFAQSEFPPKAKWDMAQIRTLLVKCNATRLINPQKAKPIAFKCLQESNAIHYYFGSIRACVQLGIIYHTNRMLDSALHYHTKAMLISQAHAPRQLIYTYANIGNVYVGKLNYDSAIFYYNRALVEEKKHPNVEIVVGVQSSLITLYKVQNNYEKAQFLIPLAIANYKKLGNHSEFAGLLFNLGVYTPITDIEERISYFTQAINEAKLGKDSFVLYTCYQELAVEYAKKKQFQKSNELMQIASVYFLQSNDLENMADYYMAKQAIEYEKNNYKKS